MISFISEIQNRMLNKPIQTNLTIFILTFKQRNRKLCCCYVRKTKSNQNKNCCLIQIVGHLKRLIIVLSKIWDTVTKH
jgi:hypothetical protein